ncbi:MAG TPA: hypothetical protein VID50_06170, partial [Candidatus Eisenbacteria bacterium]
MIALSYRRRVRTLAFAAALLAPLLVHASGGNSDPVVPLLLSLAVILSAAKLGGALAVAIGQPAVLGEIVIGIALGNLGLIGIHTVEPMKEDATLAILA